RPLFFPFFGGEKFPGGTAGPRVPIRERSGSGGGRTTIHRWSCCDLDGRRYLRVASRRASLRELGVQLCHPHRAWSGGELCDRSRARRDLATRAIARHATARSTRADSRAGGVRPGPNPVWYRELRVSGNSPEKGQGGSREAADQRLGGGRTL